MDEDGDVREAAGAAFSIMFKSGAGGASAVDAVVPNMMEGKLVCVCVWGGGIALSSMLQGAGAYGGASSAVCALASHMMEGRKSIHMMDGREL